MHGVTDPAQGGICMALDLLTAGMRADAATLSTGTTAASAARLRDAPNLTQDSSVSCLQLNTP